MSVPVLTFFSVKGGVASSWLAYHLAWMFSEQGLRVLACDFDPQADLTTMFLDEQNMSDLYEFGSPESTVYGCLEPLLNGGELLPPQLALATPSLAFLPGDLKLAWLEDTFSAAWTAGPESGTGGRALQMTASLWDIAQAGAVQHSADLILVDGGPHRGAISRAALIGADFLLVSLNADIFSLEALRGLGSALPRWRTDWSERISTVSSRAFPAGGIAPLGYVMRQPGASIGRVPAHGEPWEKRLAVAYHEQVLCEDIHHSPVGGDPECLAVLKHYRSLVALGEEARKPIFKLTVADGAIGSHAHAAQEAYSEYAALASRIRAAARGAF